MIASAGEALEIEQIRWRSRFCLLRDGRHGRLQDNDQEDSV